MHINYSWLLFPPFLLANKEEKTKRKKEKPITDGVVANGLQHRSPPAPFHLSNKMPKRRPERQEEEERRDKTGAGVFEGGGGKLHPWEKEDEVGEEEGQGEGA